MAKIVLGVWTTHGPQLNTTPEQWMLRLPADRSRKHAYKGKTYSFDSSYSCAVAKGLPSR